MMTRKIGQWVAVLGLMSLAGGAQAEGKKYLVKFKSAQTFRAVAQKVNARPALAARPGTLGKMQLFSTNATVNEALEHVQLLIVESSDAKAIESLRQHPAVALVEEEIMHPAPQPVATRGGALPMATKKKIKMDLPWGIISVKAPEAWAVTQGEGARVMVLDTGVDSAHPALMNQIEKVKNFTGSPADVTDEIGHGSHVAGTILADGGADGLKGVAPKAKLLMGKVCSTTGCPSTAIAAGINWAVAERVDVVNMSLGGVFISSAERQAISAAEAAGVFIAAASGNDGQPRVSFPAAVDTLTAVGAINDQSVKADFSNWGPELDVVAPGVEVISSVPIGTGRGARVEVDTGKGLDEVRSMPFVGSPLSNLAGALVFAGLGKPGDVAGVDLQGKIALISRGEISFQDKVNNVLAKGAVGAVIYNNAPGLIQGTLSQDGSEAAIPAVMIEQGLGESVKALLASGQAAEVNLAIIATDFASLQGTSMASPHVAGVAALIRSANRQLTPAQVRDLLKSTATPLGPNPGNEYGSGLVNADAAVQGAQALWRPVLSRAN
ncbi:MAG: S8 family serine peptidase [Bdellovibrionales bacterium]